MNKLPFRVLYREFLFRMADRELLSSHAQGDTSKLLGQFAAILILLSFAFSILVVGLGNKHVSPQSINVTAWSTEHSLIATTMLIVGLFAVLSWDSTFPDRRDVLVLSPLPVSASTIFLSKAAALGTALSITVAIFNAAPGLLFPLALIPSSYSLLDTILSLTVYRVLIAYWITMFAAGAFILCGVLTVQGVIAQLPRQTFLRLSGILQIAALCLLVGAYFLAPPLASPEAMSAARNQRLLAWLPSYWFLGLFQELNGSLNGPLHSKLVTLAGEAWIGLAVAVFGASIAFVLSYFRTLRKIVEEPDLAPGSRRAVRLPRFGNSFRTAVLHFSIRTLARSRQHRVILSFYVGIGFAIAMLFLKTPVAQKLSAAGSPWHQLSLPWLASDFVVLCFWMLGMRVIFAIPLELRANWIFRVAPLRGAVQCLPASRRALYALGLLPVWTASAVLFCWIWPWRPAAEHLAILGMVGIVFAELCLHSFHKIPFTCSYLPGKSNLHITFCLCSMLGLNLLYWGAKFELSSLSNPVRYAWMCAILCAAAVCAWWRSEFFTKSSQAEIQFDEEQPPVIVGLGLGGEANYPAH